MVISVIVIVGVIVEKRHCLRFFRKSDATIINKAINFKRFPADSVRFGNVSDDGSNYGTELVQLTNNRVVCLRSSFQSVFISKRPIFLA